MSKSESVRARMEPNLKKDAEHIFAMLGLSTTDAITLFYKQVTLHQGLPFEVKIPNQTTLDAMNEDKGLKRWDSLEALRESHR